MGDVCGSMRAVVWCGLAVAVFAVVCVHDTEAISFDELVARVSAPPKPKAKPVVKKVDPEMAEWSTEHLLGLDAPPPAHMFDELVKPKSTKKVHKTVNKAHHQAKKNVAKKKKHLRVVKKKKVVKHATSVNEAHQLAENLLDSMPQTHEHHGHRKHTHHSKKKVSHRKHGHVKKHRKKAKAVQMVTTHISDLVHTTHKAHHKAHHKVHHKKVHKKESLLSGLHLNEADAVVPEANEDDEEAFTHGLVPPTCHKKHHPTSLRGFASSMLERADKQNKAQHAEEDIKAKKAAQKAKKQAEEEAAIEKKEAERMGGHVVHLDLSQDAVDPLDENDDDEEDEDLPSLDSFMEDDDDLD